MYVTIYQQPCKKAALKLGKQAEMLTEKEDMDTPDGPNGQLLTSSMFCTNLTSDIQINVHQPAFQIIELLKSNA